MKVIAFNAPSSLETFTEVRVYDTDTGTLTQGVAGIPPAPTNGSTIIVGVYENYIFGYSTVQDEAYGKDAITGVFRSLIGVTPGSPITTTLAGNPNTRLIQSFSGYAQGSESIHIFINNASDSSPRLANIVVGPSSVTYTEQALGTLTDFYDNNPMLVEFEGGARRLVVFPPLGDNLLRYSSVIGSGSLNIAGSVTMYTAPASTTNEEAEYLGLTNAGKLADALSAFGDIKAMRSMYVFTSGGDNDGCGLSSLYLTGAVDGQTTACYVVEDELSEFYTPTADIVTFNPGFTSNTVVDTVEFTPQELPPFVSSIIPSSIEAVGVFWTAFNRTSEQP